MRLNSIKLAGFKSFVDPTQVLLKDNRTLIVGPNGCGKSNVVDAMYFVLGSTSKNLRAELMADVIFNGTTTRKPVGQASVELVFDNDEGRIAGEFASYPEISIRREINREGQNYYYLNGVRCRRRDITDIFLGTGLGNNNYAIIGQGMIARLIEAKPEELRLHVEEAAGTSKYKERRRETENRIKHTRENLDRLNDIREEQAKQLQHLQRQASAAEKYKLLKADQRLIRAELQAIWWRELNEKIVTHEQQIQIKETKLEAKIADLRNIDKEMEYKRSARTEYSDIVNEMQSQFYQLGNEINRTEQQIAHAKERKKQLEKDAEQVDGNYQELQQQHFEDQEHCDELMKDIAQVKLLLTEAKEEASHSWEKLSVQEEKMHSWQERWDEFNHISAQASKNSEVEKTKINHLEQKQQSLQLRLNRIQEEKTTHNLQEYGQEIVLLAEKQGDCTIELARLQEQVDVTQENIQATKTRYQEAQQEVTKLTKELRDLQAQHASMQALQQIALGKDNKEKRNWLQENQLQQQPRLAEGLEVEPGWEIAVETVLANHLDAICIDTFDQLPATIEQLSNANISFFNKAVSVPQVNTNHTLLTTKIRSHLPLGHLVQQIFIAEDLAEALTMVKSLSSTESIITKDGIWLSTSWLRIARQATEKTGILQREHDLKTLYQRIADQQAAIVKQEALMQEAESQLHYLTENRETVQQNLQTIKAKNSDLLAQIRAKQNFVQQLEQKEQILLTEQAEIKQQLIELEDALELARTTVLSLSNQVATDKERRETLLSDREEIKILLDAAREQATLHKQKAGEYQVRIESMNSQVHYLSQNIARAEKQLTTLRARRQELETSLESNSDPIPDLNVCLQQGLEKRAIVEEELTKARQAFDSLEASLRELEKARQVVDNEMQLLRSALEEKRLDCQTFLVKRESHEEQIKEANFSLTELLEKLPVDASFQKVEEDLQRVENKIQRLGPINLAAIDEFAALSERKEYLDKQHVDLTEALETLENAIRKIDRETKIKFKETFELLNNSFNYFFTQIFGGGEAYLELTSDDLLDTGVVVKAQPPGKKNSTIHLLSGGEKTLTAIALVFAIFNLNPAPFCVLDEVDAPLDDANVGRFCSLVRKMSEKIQFILISHNKITIEMGQQLAGVTMHEPGVSRIVSVDVEQAVSLAEV